jgi:peptide chain release factor 1
MIDQDHIRRVLDKVQAAEAALSDPAVMGNPAAYRAKVREHAMLKKLESAANAYFRLAADLESNRELAADPAGDPEMAALAAEELAALEPRLPEAERAVLSCLLPPEPADARNAVFEIRAGTGGEEAALFAAELFRMYQRYAEAKGWKVEMLSTSESEKGGFREVIAEMTGEGAFGDLKHERGVHRVQRVPTTESAGRIHTSTVTVAVMPEAEEVEVEIVESELKIDVYRSTGPGGQSVNTTDSAVRITHLPTGVVVAMQDEKSQLQNRQKAMRVLRARLYELEREKEQARLSAARKSQIGTGERAEKIRTYNYAENRLTDHRIKLTVHRLDQILDGDLAEFTDAIQAEDRRLSLEAAGV